MNVCMHQCPRLINTIIVMVFQQFQYLLFELMQLCMHPCLIPYLHLDDTIILLVQYIIFTLLCFFLILSRDWSYIFYLLYSSSDQYHNIIGQIYPLSFTIYPEHGGYLLLIQRCHIYLLTYMKLTNTLTTAAHMYVQGLDIRSYNIDETYTSSTLRDIYSSIQSVFNTICKSSFLLFIHKTYNIPIMTC